MFSFLTPHEVAHALAARVRELRLEHDWTRATLAERSGVSLGSLARFEQKGLISLDSFLRLALALDRLDDLEGVLAREEPESIAELERRSARKRRKRGTK